MRMHFPKRNPAHVEIRTAMRDLFTKLDALSNFHMMPKPVSAEVKVVSNLPSLSVEEVTPVGVSDASLLAPQEVKTKPKGELVSKGERTRTQKRERRLKKALQKRRAAKANNKAGKVTEEKRKVIKATNTELAKPVKGAKSAKGAKAVKGKSDKWAEKSLSSSKKFFERLQDQVTHTTVQKKALAHEQLALKPVPDDKAKEILLKRQTKAIRDVREELLESRSSVKTNANDSKGLRQRVPGQGGGEDFDAVLRYHNSMQEKIAEEMVSLAQNLKQNAVLAGHIVKKDTEAEYGILEQVLL
ncbi:hypothetical protein HPB52_006393 [Rhipicephalus sanguineus]|uniref:Vesicle transport protein USE1 n=1 Tax=Rhipicephalus sanguineus TaxID=34632 RepID=A0A9D4PYL9_RHISA|nr:hypothetical protein HPB52_006393 [Rhipicephalus sanguineus]